MEKYTYFVVDYELTVRIIDENELEDWKDFPDGRVLRTKKGEVEAWHYERKKWVSEPAKPF